MYAEGNGWEIHLGDCREILSTLGVEVDLVMTDEPYGLPSQAAIPRGAARTLEEPSDEWNLKVDWLGDLEFLRAGGYCAVFRASEHHISWPPCASWWSEFYIVKPAQPPTPRRRFVSSVEVCEIGWKRGGDRCWEGTGSTRNYWLGSTPKHRGNGWGHDCEKPLEPLGVLIRALSPPGGLVLDPFAGVGSTLRAAVDNGRRAIGIEIDERWCEIAARRMSQLTLLTGT